MQRAETSTTSIGEPVCLNQILTAYCMLIPANHVNQDQLRHRNYHLMGRIRQLLRIITTYYEGFALDGVVFSFKGCLVVRKGVSPDSDVRWSYGC
jgi:hypothetical protein